MEVLDHKCPACRAKLPFNPITQKWDCEYCGSSYTLKELEEFENKEKDIQNSVKKEENEENQDESVTGMDLYECPNCGAQIIADENTTATFCVYCGSTSFIKNKLKGEFKPISIIPFKNTKKQAIETFKRYRKGKLFSPKDFCDEKNIEKISGVYVPFWIYDCYSDGSITANATKTRSWRSGDYVYTKTDVYSVDRTGNMRFERVPVDGSTRFDDDTMDSIEPFDYKGLKDFNMSYLSGFLSEKYDVNKDSALDRAKFRINASSINELKSTIRGFDSVSVTNSNINVTPENVDYVLLPVWMLTIKYNEKDYLFAMNGQTGKMVGNIPIDKKKRIKAWFLSFFGVSALALIIKLVINWLM